MTDFLWFIASALCKAIVAVLAITVIVAVGLAAVGSICAAMGMGEEP